MRLSNKAFQKLGIGIPTRTRTLNILTAFLDHAIEQAKKNRLGKTPGKWVASNLQEILEHDLPMDDAPFRQFKSQIFFGNGEHSMERWEEVTARFRAVVSLLSGLEQLGLQGSEYDKGVAGEIVGTLDVIVADLAVAITGKEWVPCTPPRKAKIKKEKF